MAEIVAGEAVGRRGLGAVAGRRLLGRGEARAREEGDDREQQQAGAGAAEDFGRLDPVLLQHDPGAAERDQREDEQQDGDARAAFSRLSSTSARLRSRVSRACSAGGGGGGVAGARFGVAALLVLAQAVGHARRIRWSTDWKGWCACCEEGGELAVGDREGEGRVALLVAGDQAC